MNTWHGSRSLTSGGTSVASSDDGESVSNEDRRDRDVRQVNKLMKEEPTGLSILNSTSGVSSPVSGSNRGKKVDTYSEDIQNGGGSLWKERELKLKKEMTEYVGKIKTHVRRALSVCFLSLSTIV
jgi:hypothetical protein